MNSFGRGLFADVFHFRILRQDCPGLSGWALRAVTSALVRDTGDLTDRRGDNREDEKVGEPRLDGCGHKPRDAAAT